MKTRTLQSPKNSMADPEFATAQIQNYLREVNTGGPETSEIDEMRRAANSLGMSLEEYFHFIENPLSIFDNRDLNPIKTIEGEGYKIETRTLSPLNRDMKKSLKFRGLSSRIWFQKPVEDFQGRKNKNLKIRTLSNVTGSLRNLSDGTQGYGTLSWFGALDNELGLCILASDLEYMTKPFFEHSQDELEQWEKTGLKYQELALSKIKEIYLKGKTLPEDFFNHE